MCIFFFKQKTAYEMRISDWSSDVCSSDLSRSITSGRKLSSALGLPAASRPTTRQKRRSLNSQPKAQISTSVWPASSWTHSCSTSQFNFRSEEHTSELQSLMRISYAAFCLTKQNILLHKATIHTLYR